MSLKKLLIASILLIAVFFRFNNLSWDDNYHLHPDERFLTMVGTAMKIPKDFATYLNPKTSPLNPQNGGFHFFVYGAFPVTINKIAAVLFSNDTYNDFTNQGRILSGLADIAVVLFVFKTVELLEKKYKLDASLKYWASFFYAIAVLPIQLSHFFAVDTFLTLFMFAGFYFALRSSVWDVIFSALFFGLAVASKITAFYILPLNLLLIGLTNHLRMPAIKKIIMYFLIAYCVLRISDPYLFQNANVLDPRPNAELVANLRELKSLERPDAWYPPGVQWIHKPPLVFSLTNLVVFGLGLPYFILTVVGIFVLLKKIKKTEMIFIVFWVIGFFVFQSFQLVKAMRYFIFLYPFFAILAAFGIRWIIDSSGKNLSREKEYNFSRKFFPSLSLHILLIAILLIWPLMFSSIYFHKNSRVAASDWIYKNIPNGSLILSEHWDDSLPLPSEANRGKQFVNEQLPVFDPDTEEKWKKMNYFLQKADYYILSSNRGWGSIPTVPEKYPRMSEFYRDLFAGKTEFKEIKEFTSYPQLEIGNWKLEIPDGWADESFTVYDHPTVLIFQKEKITSVR